ncbi:ATP-dependent RNA helicase, putative [Plasmodium relictum]|uniref:ATP-dependent RNA helicase, putative n=1 Tax=Plasmodium relictum TaxID=85471 RepID=A0A1J1H5A8_PLARL|nr:ATP-dependent RNA helicase, putative [Plasmodium relictum]CRG99739.1 ATP-dependent RNA helicase, putative [Plasmodium relictum]
MNDSDEDKFFEDNGEDDCENEKNAKAYSKNEQEKDPLDEFMVEINKVIEEEKKKVELKEKMNNSFQEEYKKNMSEKELSENKKKNTYFNPIKNRENNDDDNSLDDNDATADIYEFLEKKKEELKNDNIYENENKDNDDFNFFQNEKNNSKEEEKIIDNINYDEVELEDFNKDIFITDENISNFTLEESVEYKKKNNIITIGFNVPKPLFSFLQLKNLIDKEILENIYSKSISILSPVQSIVIPIFLSGRDFIAASRTGSGKTLSFIISLIIHLLNYKKNEKTNNEESGKRKRKIIYPHALILTPTRELCVQIYDEMNKISMNKLKSCMLFNGINYKKAYDDIQKGVDILIANVKTLINFVNKKYLSLINIKYVILDEFDKLFSKQFIHSVVSILKNIRSDSLKGLFSSTFSDNLIEVIKPFLNKKFIITKIGDNNVLIDEKFYIVEENYKYSYLLNDIKKCSNSGQGFIFCNSKKNVINLYEKLRKEFSLKDISFDYIHGDIDQTERIYKLESLKKKKTQILISTDLMSRGIDIVDLNFVINFDCPSDIFIYIHRIGRCSRINNKGQAITFILPSEKKMAFLIYNHLKTKNKIIDEELENFILKNNLNNNYEMKNLKRKINSTFLDYQFKRKTETEKKINSNEPAFKKVSSSRNENSLPKNLNVITPNDVLSSSDEES